MRVNVDRNMCPYVKIVLCVHAVWDLDEFCALLNYRCPYCTGLFDSTRDYTGLFIISWRIRKIGTLEWRKGLPRATHL